MQITGRQTTTRTIADLYRALDRRQAVTITHLKEGETEPTIRTVEIHEIRTNGEGEIEIVVMCRLRGAERNFTVSRILSYTLHRIAYVLDRPAPTKYQRPAPAPADDADALFFYELARDRDDADYRPRVALAA